MTGIFSATADWLVRHRSSMPAWIDRVIESAARNPDGVAGRLASRLLGGGRTGPVTAVPDAPIRVYIAPTNYSGQGYRWARALESADPDIGARNMAVELPGGFAFTADTLVPVAVVNSSSEWQSAEWAAAQSFSHVLIEAERPIFGSKFGRDVAREIAEFESSDVSVAYLCHGTDIRNPDRHATLTPWSMYPEDPRTDVLRADAEANLELLNTLRRPTFVSTPDLLLDVPWATWCPVVVDPAAFANDVTPFASDRVRIVHAASAPLVKGSHWIEPAIEPLVRSGIAEFSLVTGTAASRMPVVFAEADIVIDQFRAGSYGVAACEAMAAGRVVIGHVLPFVRDRVEAEFGVQLPIVEATPDTLAETVRRLAEDRPAAQAIAAAGIDYVAAVHSGPASARALIDHWISPPLG
ncbi:MAG: glycosyltransferase [Agromyces sp.]